MDEFDYETRELRRAVEALTEAVENLTRQIGQWDPVEEMLQHVPANLVARHRGEEL